MFLMENGIDVDSIVPENELEEEIIADIKSQRKETAAILEEIETFLSKAGKQI